MIVVDLSTVLWSGVYAQAKNGRIDDDLIRHIILNSLRSVRAKYGKKYGELVICADGRKYWRKELNPYYKASRKKARDKSKLDMAAIFHGFDQIKEDLRETFPYTYIEMDRAEADDIIGVMCRKYSSKDNPCLIYSSDHDFWQLQQYQGVTQISPQTKREVTQHLSHKLFLREHIIIGDSGDGVTNVFSPTETLVTEGVRQKSVSKKKLATWITMTPEEFCADTGVSMERYKLNQDLVDLSKTPQDIVDEIVGQFLIGKKTPIGGWSSKLLRYFSKHKMKIMMNYLNDFVMPVRQKIEERTGDLDEFF